MEYNSCHPCPLTVLTGANGSWRPKAIWRVPPWLSIITYFESKTSTFFVPFGLQSAQNDWKRSTMYWNNAWELPEKDGETMCGNFLKKMENRLGNRCAHQSVFQISVRHFFLHIWQHWIKFAWHLEDKMLCVYKFYPTLPNKEKMMIFAWKGGQLSLKKLFWSLHALAVQLLHVEWKWSTHTDGR